MSANAAVLMEEPQLRLGNSREVPMDVLLLEDSPTDALLVEQQLRDAGANIRLTMVGQLRDGLRSIEMQSFQAALVDLNLPDSLGIETFERFHAAAPHIPIIVLSGLEDAAMTLQMLRLGAQDCLLKREVFGGLLNRAIQFAIERQRLSEQLEDRVADLGRIESRIRAMIESSPDAFVVLGLDGALMFSNAAARSMLGSSIDSLVLDSFAERLVTGEPVEIEILRSDGSAGCAELRSISGTWSLAVAGTLLSLRDITDRKHRDRAIRDSEHRMRALIEHSSDGIVTTNRAGNVTFQSPSMALLTGYSASDLSGADVHSFVHREDYDRWMQSFDFVARQTSQSKNVEWRWRHKHGHWLWLDGVMTNLLGDPSVEGIVINFRDITERKRTEEAQLQSQKLESLGTLSAGIAHDFNNMLLAISGNAKLAVADLPDDHPSRVCLHEIDAATTRATNLVRRILAFGRCEPPKRECLDLVSVLQEALQMLRPMLPAAIDLQTRIADGLPLVAIDSSQVHQVFVNLISNAAYAIGKLSGTILSTIETVSVVDGKDVGCADLAPGEYVCASITDSGCGISSVDLERVFEPFYTTKARGEGSGLGLSVAHGIMRAHEGAIAADSQVEHGTTFRLYFPVAISPKQALAAESILARQVTQGAGERLMYVDDEESLVFLVTRSLTRLGYIVEGFTDATAALQMLREHPQAYDAIITDLSMPTMTGFQFGAEVRTINTEVPVILTSGYVRQEDRDTAQRLGIRKVILKPDTIEELSTQLHEILTSDAN